jgi:ribosomal RNA-processing protein 12
VSKSDAESNLRYLENYANNLLAVLFNVYTQTLPQYRAPILQCINAYLGIAAEKDLVETFGRVTSTLESSLAEANGQSKEKQGKEKGKENKMPPMSHTLMDLVITISVYLPRSSLAQLFSIASLMLGKEDPNLQKKAYKLIPRLGSSIAGKLALQERSGELQALLLGCSESTSPAALRDRLAAMACIIEFLPIEDLHFLPSVLPEVTIATKETNEKARTMAFDLLVAIGEKMQQGGTIINSKVPHMPADAADVAASLDEYFKMVSAGLAGTSPHSVSASITALTRILYHFRNSLPEATIADLVQTMDIFLKSPNREIVRSVLGFVKVSVISLPLSVVQPRLPTLIPNLLSWSHEHKAHLQAKVKHIFERMIRRFGVELVDKYTPESDKKLVANIRKTRERRKKKKSAADEEGDKDGDEQADASSGKRRSKFESGYDEAVYGSDGDSSESGSDVSDDEVLGRKRRGKTGRDAFIIEDEDEPLDLLDRRALGNISSTRPLKKMAPKGKRKAKVDVDGKLVLGDDDEDMVMRDAVVGTDANLNEGDGINAYVQAIRGGNAPRRGQKGKLKFSNRPGRKDDDDDDGDNMAIDPETNPQGLKGFENRPRMRAGNSLRGKGGKGGKGGGGMKAVKAQRRGLGVEKTRGGRVGKNSPAKVARH